MQDGNKPLKKKIILESTFKRRVIRELKSIPNLYYFVKEARSLVGIPDIIICYNSRFIAWELKRSESEILDKNGKMHEKGRHRRQFLEIVKILKAQGSARFVYPENFDEAIEDLLNTSAQEA